MRCITTVLLHYHWPWAGRAWTGPMIYGCSQLQVTEGYVTSPGCGVYGNIVFNGSDDRVPDVGSALMIMSSITTTNRSLDMDATGISLGRIKQDFSSM